MMFDLISIQEPGLSLVSGNQNLVYNVDLTWYLVSLGSSKYDAKDGIRIGTHATKVHFYLEYLSIIQQ